MVRSLIVHALSNIHGLYGCSCNEPLVHPCRRTSSYATDTDTMVSYCSLNFFVSYVATIQERHLKVTQLFANQQTLFRDIFTTKQSICGCMEQLEQVEIRRKLILYFNAHAQNSIVSLLGKWHFCAVLIHCVIACELVYIQAHLHLFGWKKICLYRK